MPDSGISGLAASQWFATKGRFSGPWIDGGRVSTLAMNANSVSRLLRMAFACNGLDGAAYSGHSMHRGFAT